MHTKLHQTASKGSTAAATPAPGRSADAIAAAGVLLLGALLCLTGLGLMDQLEDASARKQEVSFEELMAAAAAVAGAAVIAWWVLSMTCAAIAAVLDRKGRTRAAAATRRLSPAFMQRLALGALSLQLLSGPVAHAAAAAPGPEWAPTQTGSSSAPAIPATAGTSIEGIGKKETGAEVTGAAGSGLPSLSPVIETVPGQGMPAPSQQANLGTLGREQERVTLPEQGPAVEATPPSTFHPGWQPAAPVVNPGLLAAPATRGIEGAAGPQVEGVTVQAGDTLWDIAARHLGHGASDLDVALQWPRWYEANQALIGQNPDVLLPGQILQPPFSVQK